jgi:hypothetical protein
MHSFLMAIGAVNYGVIKNVLFQSFYRGERGRTQSFLDFLRDLILPDLGHCGLRGKMVLRHSLR